MKKRLLWTLMLLSSTATLACPACGGFDGADIDSNHEDNHSAMTSFTNKDGSINLNNFKESKFELTYSTPLWQKEIGKHAVFPFFDHENLGNLNIKAATKLADKHIFFAEIDTGLNIIPSIYNDTQHQANLKKFYDKYTSILSDKSSEIRNDDPLIYTKRGKIAKAIGEFRKMQDPGVSPENKTVVAPLKVINFKYAKLSYEYNYNKEAKLNIGLQIKGNDSFKFDISPSYDFATYFNESENFKVKKLKVLSNYSFASTYILGRHAKENEYGLHNVSFGAEAKFRLPYDFDLDINLNKLVNIEAKYDRNAHLNKTPRYPKNISGAAKIELSKIFDLYKDEKHQLSLANKVSWQPEWVWNEASKTFKKTKTAYFILNEEAEYKYPTKFITDKIEAATKLTYSYKINDDFTFKSGVKLKYEGVKNRITTDAKRENKFYPTAQLGIKYDHNINDKTNVFAEFDTDFTSKEILDAKIYLIEPKIKAGIKYTY